MGRDRAGVPHHGARRDRPNVRVRFSRGGTAAARVLTSPDGTHLHHLQLSFRVWAGQLGHHNTVRLHLKPIPWSLRRSFDWSVNEGMHVWVKLHPKQSRIDFAPDMAGWTRSTVALKWGLMHLTQLDAPMDAWDAAEDTPMLIFILHAAQCHTEAHGTLAGAGGIRKPSSFPGT